MLERTQKRSIFLFSSFLLLVTFVYGQVLFFDLVWDDPLVFSGLKNAIAKGTLWEIFWKPYWEVIADHSTPYYRPFFMLAMVPDLYLGESAMISHGINLALHVVNICLAYHVSKAFLRSERASFFVAGIWGFHPIVNETVAFVSARESLLQGMVLFAGLLTLMRHVKRPRWQTYFLAILLSFILLGLKEIAVSTFLLFPLTLWIFGSEKWKPRIVSILPFVFILTTYLLFFRFVVVANQSSSGSSSTSFLSFSSAWMTMIGEILQRLFLPLNLSADYGPPIDEPLKVHWLVLSFLWILISFIGVYLFRLVWVRKTKSLIYGLALLPIVPPMFLLHRIENFADRYLYLSSFGLILLCASYLSSGVLLEKVSVGRSFLLFIIVLGLFSFASQQRIKVWKSKKSLYSDMLKGNTHSLHGQLGYAGVLSEEGQVVEARIFYERVLQTHPTQRHALSNLAQLEMELGHPQKALALLQNALESDPHAFETNLTCARIQIVVGHLSKAEECLAIFKAERPKDINTIVLQATIDFMRNHNGDVEETLLSHWDEGKKHPEYLHSLSQIQRRKGRLKESAKTLQRLVEIRPKPIYYNDLGISLIKAGELENGCSVLKDGVARFSESPLLQGNFKAACKEKR